MLLENFSTALHLNSQLGIGSRNLLLGISEIRSGFCAGRRGCAELRVLQVLVSDIVMKSEEKLNYLGSYWQSATSYPEETATQLCATKR